MSSTIPGDPAGMRAKAAELRARAEGVSVWADRLAGQVGRMEYQGPAANRLRDRMSGWQQGVKSAAGELAELADVLLRSAAEVEARQRAAGRR